MVDRNGQQFGHYRLVRLLGQGAFADVYLAKHEHLETWAAIKVLSTRLTSDNVEHFRSEARTVARLLHPNIVRVFDFGVEDDTPYLAMDYAPHGSLRQRHSKGTQLSLDTILSYVKQVGAALQFAHEKKLIHRDIKPENMLLGENDTVLLSDFGIAVISHSSGSQITQNLGGTIPYMAPEQIKGKPLPASDQYALGVVTYEWLCGTRPFHGSFTEIATQHIFTPPPPLREKLPSVPTMVEEVVLVALAKDPKQRFATVQEFATALEQAVQYSNPRAASTFNQLPLSRATPPPLTISSLQSPIAEMPSLADQSLQQSGPSFSQKSILNSDMSPGPSTVSREVADSPVQPQQLTSVSHSHDLSQSHRESLEGLQPTSGQHWTQSATTGANRRKITRNIALILLLLVLAFGGIASYLVFGQLGKSNSDNTHQLRTSTPGTSTPLSTPTLPITPTVQIVALSSPVIDKYSFHEIADGQAIYTLTAHARSRQTGNPVFASGITCKIWLTSDSNVFNDVQGDGGARLKSIATLAEPFPGELADSLIIGSSTPQVQPSNSNGQATWKYMVSATVNPGNYNLVVLFDWRGVYYNYAWLTITIAKAG